MIIKFTFIINTWSVSVERAADSTWNLTRSQSVIIQDPMWSLSEEGSDVDTLLKRRFLIRIIQHNIILLLSDNHCFLLLFELISLRWYRSDQTVLLSEHKHCLHLSEMLPQLLQHCKGLAFQYCWSGWVQHSLLLF